MIEIYVRNIEESLKHECYFSALALALTLPDICGSAEYPPETTVTERYIGWYDRYVGRHMKNDFPDGHVPPWLSGEVIYNLRNTFLHQGNPALNACRVKQEENRLDDFTLLLGDGTVLQQMASVYEIGPEDHRTVIRSILVDVTYLCRILCETALGYYRDNQEKFFFGCHIMRQEELLKD